MNRYIQILGILLTFFASISNANTAENQSQQVVANFFDATITYQDIQPSEKRLRIFSKNNPELSSEEVLVKAQANKLSGIIWAAIFEKIVDENILIVSRQDLEDYFNSPLKEHLSKEEVEQRIKRHGSYIKVIIERYKIDKFLYQKYGGVVIFQQGNPFEPVGAYKALLLEYQQSGELSIHSKAIKESFMHYYLRKHPYEHKKEDIDFSQPWWMQSPKN